MSKLQTEYLWMQWRMHGRHDDLQHLQRVDQLLSMADITLLQQRILTANKINTTIQLFQIMHAKNDIDHD